MELTQAVILALIQGITEFLPISSSAHLILVPLLTDWPDQGLAFDIVLNTATWLAVVIYLRRDIAALASGFIASIVSRSSMTDKRRAEARLAWMVLVATVPVGVAGLLAHNIVALRLRTFEVIAVSSIIWGIVLWIADHKASGAKGVRLKDLYGLGWGGAIIIGLAQAIALIPGTSRSGITITAALLIGMTRGGAARFSFLLAVIVGALAGAKETVDMIQEGSKTPALPLIVGFIVAFVAAYLVIHFFLRLLDGSQKSKAGSSMTPFVAYRVALGIILLLISRYF
ncbi:Undecaprenyl-diphosphatase [hydrothermal vent metagenome]|uniref:Undecaprenyl-diphosphatase n=1 Tax=hydrothermal vent metagenome TaxID=652676 RepID=A0A3B0UZK3_9ZZZZ